MTSMPRLGLRAFLAFALLVVACDLFGGPSRVRSGQLYAPGSPEYDAYFKDVHLLQVAAAGWDDDKKSSRRPLVDALKLNDGVADVSISQATHERMVAVAHEVGPARLEVKNDEPHVLVSNEGRLDAQTRELFRTIEGVVRAELARAKTLRQIPAKVDGLTKTGKGLQPRVTTDFGPRGGDAASAVKQELDASIEVLNAISLDSRNGALEAEDFVADLQRSVVADPSEPLTRVDGGAPVTATKPPPRRPPTGTTTPATTGAAPPPAHPPKPAGGDGEDFNP